MSPYPAHWRAGDACRKEICDAAVEACIRTDPSLNPFARTEAENKRYCGDFSNGCMTRTVWPGDSDAHALSAQMTGQGNCVHRDGRGRGDFGRTRSLLVTDA